jgi:hypothetical protein
MQSETKNCQNCKNQFIIEPDDFAFYEKMKVPAPTWCPQCRQVRRMAWRNDRSLYRRTCNAPEHGEQIISVFSSQSSFVVYDQSFWWSDAWDSLSYGDDYNFSESFFEQFKKLLGRTPHLALRNIMPSHTEYAQNAANNKNCYLVSAAGFNENVTYANRIVGSKDSIDVYLAGELEFSYEVVNAGSCYKLFFSSKCEDCRDSWFLYDCRNCSDCFGCVGLRNKQYHIFNEPYTKEEYQKRIAEFDIGSYKVIEGLKKQHKDFILQFPHKYMYTFLKTVDVTGDGVGEAKNCHFCFDGRELENCKFCAWVVDGVKDTYDAHAVAYKSELLYEVNATVTECARVLFSTQIANSHSVQYSYNCYGSNNIFGCANLRDKSYCILNKQYTKEEYESLVPKIIQHMNDMPYTDKRGRVYKYGEFFPVELSPFSYNETVAQEYFSSNKAQVQEQGYYWKDSEEKSYQVAIETESLPDHIGDVDETILGKIIGCAHRGNCSEQCTTAFKVIKEELQFYKKMNLPLPRLCPNCRHYERLKQRNPLKLWHRKCTCAGVKSVNRIYQNQVKHSHGEDACPVEFETSYAPERPEIVYCENCYNSEVA